MPSLLIVPAAAQPPSGIVEVNIFEPRDGAVVYTPTVTLRGRAVMKQPDLKVALVLIDVNGRVRAADLDGRDSVVAASGANTISGGPGDDNLTGGNGKDTIDGEPGNDQISSEQGTDTINAGDGDDIILIWYWHSGGGVEVINGGPGKDTLILNNINRSQITPSGAPPPTSFRVADYGEGTFDVRNVEAVK